MARGGGPSVASRRFAQRAADRARHRAARPHEPLWLSPSDDSQFGATGFCGIRFDQARAASRPWTLASHANIFTGRWPHELAIEWACPLRGDVPTLAEHMGSLGYATAGFVGNTLYCAYDGGLDRGFTDYEDYVLDELMRFAQSGWSTTG